MLRYTLVLPETDPKFAARALQDAVDDLNVIVMLVLGLSKKAEEIVPIADQLCEGSGQAGYRRRRVVWVRDATSAEVRTVLDPILGAGKSPLVAVLNFHDQVKATLDGPGVIDAVDLEIAFLKGYEP